jgi:hypothetical protein
MIKDVTHTSWPMHVLPMNDFREHVADMSCWCCPTLDDGWEEGIEKIFIHHSMDGREKYETGERVPS